MTVLTGYGLKGEKMVLMISTDRKSLPRLTEIIEEFAPDSFVTILETRNIAGRELLLTDIQNDMLANNP